MTQDQKHYNYWFMQSGERGSMVFAANNTVSFSPTNGGYNTMDITNEISLVRNEGGGGTEPKSLISGGASSGPTESGTESYTINGSTVTIGAGKAIGTLSADGRILIFSSFDSGTNKTGFLIAIRR